MLKLHQKVRIKAIYTKEIQDVECVISGIVNRKYKNLYTGEITEYTTYLTSYDYETEYAERMFDNIGDVKELDVYVAACDKEDFERYVNFLEYVYIRNYKTNQDQQ
jgi:hypothetical protein